MTTDHGAEMVSREKYERLLEANRKLVARLEALEAIEDERDRALGALEDARRELVKLRRGAAGQRSDERKGQA